MRRPRPTTAWHDRDAASPLGYHVRLHVRLGETLMAPDPDIKAADPAEAPVLNGLEAFVANAAEAYKAFVIDLPLGRYDIFLSHAAQDKELVDGLCAEMTALGL